MKIKDVKVGKLRRKFSLQRREKTPDGAGGFTFTWPEEAVIWGSLDPLSARETWTAQKLEVPVTHRMVTRWTKSLTVDENKRLVLEGQADRIFNIRGVINIEERDRFLDVLVEEGVAQ